MVKSGILVYTKQYGKSNNSQQLNSRLEILGLAVTLNRNSYFEEQSSRV